MERTVTIKLEEYDALRKLRDNKNIGQWYTSYRNGTAIYDLIPETEATEKIQNALKNEIKKNNELIKTIAEQKRVIKKNRKRK